MLKTYDYEVTQIKSDSLNENNLSSAILGFLDLCFRLNEEHLRREDPVRNAMSKIWSFRGQTIEFSYGCAENIGGIS